MPTSLVLTKTLLDQFVLADVYDRADDLEAQVLDVVAGLDVDEVAQLASSLSAVLQVLESDLLRWRALGDLLVRLDMFELTESLLASLQRTPDAHQAGNLATLSTNPAIATELRRQVTDFVLGLDVPQGIARLLRVRLGEPARSEWEQTLAAQVWPGAANTSALSGFTPLVYVATHGARADTPVRAAATLARAGARIRRIVPVATNATAREPTPWASPAYPLLYWSGVGLSEAKLLLGGTTPPAVLAPERLMTGGLDAPRLAARVEELLPFGTTLRRRPHGPAGLPAAFSPETLQAGAYDSAEMGYLAAASRSTLQRFAREGLSPRNADVYRWNFSQLVAARLVQGFRAAGMRYRRQPSDLVTQLRDIAAASASQRIALGPDGDVYFDDGRGFRNVRTNQQAIEEVLAVDDAFRPFELGGGRIPDLLRPSRFTTVHPMTLGGTPCVEERRISARAIAAAVHRSHSSSIVLRSAYPELTAEQLSDALAVGDAIQARAST